MTGISRRYILKAGTALGAVGLLSGLPGIASAQQAGDRIRKIVLVARPQAADTQAYQAAELIVQAWRQLGLDIEIRAMPRPQQSELVWFNRDRWDMTMWQMVGRPERSDPDELVFNLFHSSVAARGYNFVGYVNPEYDRLAEQQRLETDEEKRRTIIRQAQEIIARDQPYFFLVFPKWTLAYDSRVWDPASIVDQKGIGIRNTWTFIQARPVGSQQDMILNTNEEVRRMNPLYISGATDSWMTELIWDRLMRIDKDGRPVPWAAESVRWVNPTRIECVIREGMKWHDGRPVTMEDIVFSFTAPALEEEVGGRRVQRSPNYKPFVENIKEVKATGPRTITFDLKEPQSPFLTSTLAKINLIPKHVWQPILDGLKGKPETVEQVQEERPIGSGPFKYVRWRTREEVVLERNPEHWAAPKMNRWILRIVPNQEATLGMLRRGELNFLGAYRGDPEVLVEMGKELSHIRVVSTTDMGFQFVAPNLRRKPFDDPAFRRALSTAINRTQMAQAAWNGFADPANSHVSNALPFWFNESTNWIGGDMAEARRILEQAGYRNIRGRLHYPAGVREPHGG
ncbi:MAG: twin-arginine translocation pathway signal protein [Alphaproteobacteria bacterium]|nr:twin-arginine translocation pathway signal protein [Alphaproteobacteria bacterium]